MKSILELNHTEARQYFLKEKNYFSFELPKYFTFEKLLLKISDTIAGKPIEDFYLNPPDYTKSKPKAKQPFPSDFDNTNYKLLNNKDGKFAYRQFQLIHPALYVSLVHNITDEANWNLIIERFEQFSSNPKIKCYSIPLQSEGVQSDKATSVTNWWNSIEQQSIELALSFEYVLHTDVANCYGSIYTHSVPWAIHTKPVAKSNRDPNGNIGNIIDKHLKYMAFGQTNGIPEGSVMMDFIAEMVLGYADDELGVRIKQEYFQGEPIKDYQIIRYRDDYRIFTNNPQVAEHITKLLTEVLIDLGLRLNPQKTSVSNNVVRDSIKDDKLFWIISQSTDKLFWITPKKGFKGIQEHLLLLHNLAEKFPNSGSLQKALLKFYHRVKDVKEIKQNIKVLISILVDIMYKNPKTYPITTAILSKLISLIEEPSQREDILQAVESKFKKIPNTGHIKIWLQRLTIKYDRSRIYEENLCRKVNDPSVFIWNSDWLNNSLKKLISSFQIIDEQRILELPEVIDSSEVGLFETKTEYGNNSSDFE